MARRVAQAVPRTERTPVKADVERAAALLARGRLVAFPTETVYGLGADASDPQAIARLYAVKGRPADHPVIVHFPDAEGAFAWAREVPDAARVLAARFWPGPLTLILKRAAHVGDYVTGAQDTVGVRVPAHALARQLLEAFRALHADGGLAAPSANRFGRVSPTSARHVADDLGEDVDFILDGGPCSVGIESTIVDLSRGKPVLLRPGGVTPAQIEEALGEPLQAPEAVALASEQAAPRVSGGLPAHYAPKTPARLVASVALDAEIGRFGNRVAVLAFLAPDERVDFWLRMPREPDAYAQRLYAALRELDGAGCAQILIEAPPDEPRWRAVLDRLRRATLERK